VTTLLDGKYVLDRRLGGGGMAEVFLGRTLGKSGFQRPVAIKCILPHYCDQQTFVDMFIREAQLTAKLRHPNVVSVLDFDQDRDHRLFLVMDLVDGVDLNGLLGTGPLPFELIIFVITEVIRGLGYAHNLPIGDDGVRGLVHRDVSPHNVLLSWQGEVKVSDFGIAKARAATEATGSLMVKGKPAYMSPEQANGGALDGRSDLFSVGIMLWEMLSGEPLFASDTLERTLSRVLFEPIVKPSVINRDIPPDLERCALRLLERDHAKRYPNAEAAIADLTACESHPRDGRDALAGLLAERFPGRAPLRLGDVRHATPDAQTIATPRPTGAPTRTARPPRRRSRRGGRLALVAVLGLAFVGAGVGIALAVRGASKPVDASADPTQPAPSRAAPSPQAAPATPPTTMPAGTPAIPASAETSTALPAAVTQPTSTSPAATKQPARPSRERTAPGRTKPSGGIEEIKLGGS